MKKNKVLANLSFIFGLLGLILIIPSGYSDASGLLHAILVLINLICPIAAMIIGIISLVKTKNNPEIYGGETKAIIGIVLGIVFILVFLLWIIPQLGNKAVPEVIK